MLADADQHDVHALKVFQPPVFRGGIMSSSNKSFEVEPAPPRCFQVLSAAEYIQRLRFQYWLMLKGASGIRPSNWRAGWI